MTARDILKQHFHKALNDNYLKDVVYPETWVEEATKEYAEYYAKIAIRNTRYKAIEIVQSNLERSDIIEREIQNIQNHDVLPPHD